jgi:uncharacterized membrane protein YdjX (TVP38/TMEM64 family)
MSGLTTRRRLACWAPRLAVALVLVGVIVLLAAWGRPLYDLMANQEQVHSWVEDFGPWGPAVIIVLEVAQVLLAPIPGQAIGAVSGYVFGLWLGTLYTMFGLVAGSLIGFALARRLGRFLLFRQVKPQTRDRLDTLARRGGALFFFLVWLFPFFPDDLACLAAGLTPMSLRKFLVLMTLGRFPGVFTSVWLGAHASSLSPAWWGVLLVGLALVAVAIWRWGPQAQSAMLRTLARLAGHQDDR